MHPLLSIRNLTIQFKQDGRETCALNNISLEVEREKITALVGESGSGKSVTALSILQLLPKGTAVSGNIFYGTGDEKLTDLTQLSTSAIKEIRGHRIAMIFQEPMTSLNPVFTCGYQVMEVLVKHLGLTKKAARKKTIELFEQVELPDPATMYDRYPHQLSGGQKQRVMIAMAISCRPTLLIADEPTTALDVRVQKNILSLLRKLQQEHQMAILLITHDLGLVADVADNLYVLYKGTIAEQGTAAGILSNPRHRYTKALLACRPGKNSKGKRLPVADEIQGMETIKDALTAISSMKAQRPSSYTPALTVENLNVHFPASRNFFGKTTGIFKAVDDVSFTVMQHETVGLVGESGCGKTTLGRAILQLIQPTSGKVLLNGIDINSLSAISKRKARKDLQIVFQDPYGSLNPRITIGEAITEPMQVHGLYHNKKERKEKAAALLQQVRLSADMLNRYPHQFSGGQRQRICIARALAMEPSFLIFDESVSALDVSVQAQVLNLINELKASHNFTSIFISHDLSVVHYISDRILVMQHGRIVEEGSADKIFYDPSNEYTRKLVDAIPGKSLSGID